MPVRRRSVPGPLDSFWRQSWLGTQWWPPVRTPLVPDERALQVFADPEFIRLGQAYVEACHKGNVIDAYQIAMEKEHAPPRDT